MRACRIEDGGGGGWFYGTLAAITDAELLTYWCFFVKYSTTSLLITSVQVAAITRCARLHFFPPCKLVHPMRYPPLLSSGPSVFFVW